MMAPQIKWPYPMTTPAATVIKNPITVKALGVTPVLASALAKNSPMGLPSRRLISVLGWFMTISNGKFFNRLAVNFDDTLGHLRPGVFLRRFQPALSHFLAQFRRGRQIF